MTGPFNPHCLHCRLVATIQKFYSERDERDASGAVLIDMSEVVAKLGEVTAEMVHRAPSRPQRRQYERFARECLEAGFRHQVTGRVQAVSPGGPISEH